MDRRQWEDGQYTITRTLPYIFTELSPLNFVFVIMNACLSDILESTKGIVMELGL